MKIFQSIENVIQKHHEVLPFSGAVLVQQEGTGTSFEIRG